MKRMILSLILLLINISLVSGDKINNYTILKIKNIPIGEKDGQLGVAIVPEGEFGALTFLITNNKIYISDSANSRLNIYNLTFKFQYSISNTENIKIGWAEKYLIDKNENILFINHYDGLTMSTNKGMMIFHINRYNLPDDVNYGQNIFLINSEIYMYNDNYEIEVLTEAGKKKIKVQEKLQLIDNEQKNNSFKLSQGIRLPNDVIQIIENLKKTGRYLILGDKFYSTSYRQTKEYFEKIKEVREKVIELETKNNLHNRNQNDQTISVNLFNHGVYFIGYDDEHDSYWEVVDNSKKIRKQFILIYSKYGELLDAFYYGQIVDYDYDLKAFQFERPGCMPSRCEAPARPDACRAGAKYRPGRMHAEQVRSTDQANPLMIAKLIILPAEKSLIFRHLHLIYNSMANRAIKIYPEIYQISIIS